MKAELGKDGTLTVRAETELEAYALGCWEAGRAKRKGRTELVIDATIDATAARGVWLANDRVMTVPLTGTVASVPYALTDHDGDCQ